MEPVAAEATDAVQAGIEHLRKADATLEDELSHIAERREKLQGILKGLDDVRARLESDREGLATAINAASDLSVARVQLATEPSTARHKRKRKKAPHDRHIPVKDPRRCHESHPVPDTQERGAASESDSDVFEKNDRKAKARKIASKVAQAAKTASERDNAQMHKGRDDTWGD